MSDRKDRLTSDLVGERHELYLKNAHFYHSVNWLVSMLPLWVDAIAAEAVTSAAQDAERVRVLTTMTTPLHMSLRKDTIDE